jgi:drug/metabolite transporter (DMT)-like permease
VSWVSAGALSYLIIFGSLVAFTAYSWLLRNVTPAKAATYAYVNPVVSVFLGWLIASEPISVWMLIGAAIIVGSVMLITTYGSEGAKPPATETDLVTSRCPSHPCA